MAGPGTQTQSGTDGARTAAQTAQGEGRELAQSAAESTKQVAQTVKQEASNVTGEVASQAKTLASEATDKVQTQLDEQRSRVANTLRTTGDELGSLATEHDHSRLTAELTRRAAEQARSVADYLERTSPNEVLDQARDFARRRPGAFLVAAGLAGFVVGRVFRSATAAGGTTQTSRVSPGYVSGDTAYPAAEPLATYPSDAPPAGYSSADATAEPTAGYPAGSTYAGSAYTGAPPGTAIPVTDPLLAEPYAEEVVVADEVVVEPSPVLPPDPTRVSREDDRR
jgi:hypothetical protein